nr:MAG TPA: hypothetical protein [Caudoviricetes sp.]
MMSYAILSLVLHCTGLITIIKRLDHLMARVYIL